MMKITPYLWFQKELEKAIKLYTTLFPQSKIQYLSTIPNVANEDNPIATSAFFLLNQEFFALEGGPYYRFTPSISLFVSCQTPQEVEKYWKALSVNGEILMDLGEYPFNPHYGWLNDQFGLSWQFALDELSDKITPFLMFSGVNFGKGKEAINNYISIFPNSFIEDPDKNIFSLNGLHCRMFESNIDHSFQFTPAFSFFIACDTQEEIDYYWEKLAESGELQMCGWLKDRYGVSWQVIPSVFDDYMNDLDLIRRKRVMDALLKMKKIDIRLLQQAYFGSST